MNTQDECTSLGALEDAMSPANLSAEAMCVKREAQSEIKRMAEAEYAQHLNTGTAGEIRHEKS